MTDIYSLSIKSDTTQINVGKKDLDNLAVAADRAEKETGDLTASIAKVAPVMGNANKATDALTGGLNKAKTGTLNMRAAAGQLGFQVQDMAVQLQAGQSALLVLGQQGSQVASIFGPGGAMIGALLAVGAAVASALIPSLGDVKEEVDKVDLSVKGLIERIDELTVKQAGYAIAALTEERDELLNVGGAANIASARIETLNMNLANFPNSKLAKEWQKELQKLESDADTFAQAVGDLDEKIGMLKDRIAQVSSGGGTIATEEDKNRILQAQQYVEALKEEAETIGLNTQQLVKYQAAKLGLSDTETKSALAYARTAEAKAKAMRDESQALKDLEKAKRDQENADKALATSAQNVIDKLDPAAAAFREVAREQQTLIDAYDKGLVSMTYDELLEALDKLSKKNDEVAKSGEETAEKFSNGFSQGAERIASTLQDTIASGDWSGLGMIVAGAFAGGIGGAVTDQLAQQLGEGAGAAILGPIGGAIAGGLVGLAANAIADFFRDDFDPTEALQASQGTGTVLGSIDAKSESIRAATEAIESSNAELVNINIGMLNALKAVQQGIVGATAMIAGGRSGLDFQSPAVDANFFAGNPGGMLAGGVAGSGLASLFTGGIGAALGGLGSGAASLIDSITFGLFGKLGEALGGKSRQVDEGIDIIGGTLAELIDNTVVSAFATFRVKKNAFSSTKTVEQSRILEGEITNQFSQVFSDILASVVQGGASLGIDPAQIQQQLSGFVIETQRLSLEGLDAAAQEAEIQAVFGKLFDDLVTTAVPFLADFQRAGEGLGETLARVSTEVALTKEAASALGFTLLGVPLSIEAMATAASELVMMTGGIEAFSNAMRTFEGAFLSTEEQTALASRRLTDALGELPLPETRDAFKDLLQAQDASTEAGRANIATLLTLSGAADQYYSGLEDAARKLAEAAERAAADAERAAQEAQRAIERAAAEAEREAAAAQRAAERAAAEAERAAEAAAREIARIFAELQRAAEGALANLKTGVNAQIAAVEAQRQSYVTGLSTATSTTDGIMGQLTGIVSAQRAAATERLKIEQDAIRSEMQGRKAAASGRLTSQRNAIKAETDLRLEANGIMLDAAKTMVSEIGRELSGISSALQKLVGEISPNGTWDRAVATLRNALSTGNLTGTGEAAGIAANIDSRRFGSATDLSRAQGTTANLLAQLEDMGQGQLSTAEQTVAVLTAQNDVIKASSEAQIAAVEQGASRAIVNAENIGQKRLDAAQEQHDKEVDRLDKLISDAQEYINVSRGIAAGITTVDEAIRLGLESLKLEAQNRGALQNGKFDEQISELNAIYDTAQEQLNVLRGINAGIGDIAGLKRSFDAALEAERAALAAQGVSVPAFASGGMHSGGVRVVGENGPELEFTGPSRIMSNADTGKLMGFGDLLAEMRALRDDLQAGQIAIAKNTSKTAKQLERWDLQGLPEERVFA